MSFFTILHKHNVNSTPLNYAIHSTGIFILSFNALNNSMMYATVILPFYRWGSWVTPNLPFSKQEVEVAFSLTPKPLLSYLAVNFSIVTLEKCHRWVGKENILKEVGNLYWSCNYSFFKKMGKTGLKVSRLASKFCVICTLQSEKVDCGVNETLLSNLLKSWHFLTVISGCLIFQLQIH